MQFLGGKGLHGKACADMEINRMLIFKFSGLDYHPETACNSALVASILKGTLF